MTIFTWLIVGFWLVFYAYWIISARTAKKTVGGVGKGMMIRVAIAFAVLLILRSPVMHKLDGYHRAPTGNPIVGSIAVVLCALGFGFAIWARRHLGRNWGMPMTLREEPELVTSGPYRYVRHPIYSGILLALIGTALVSGTQWLLLDVVVAGYFVFAGKTEEKHMLQRFPSQYPAYKKSTKMLVPFVV